MEFQRNQLLSPFRVYLQIITCKVLQAFLYQSDHPQPCLFLAYYLLKHFHFITLNSYTNYLIFAAGIITMIITRKNYYFYYLAFLEFQSLLLNLCLLLIGISNLNEKYKSFLLVFCLSHYLDETYLIRSIFQMCMSALICWEISKNLIFQSLDKNLQYFVTFSVVSVISLYKIVAFSFQKEENSFFMACIVLLAIILSYRVITKKIGLIHKNSIDEIGNIRLIHFKIQMLQENPNKCREYFQTHKLQCLQINCFCHQYCLNSQETFSQLSSKLISCLYLQTIQKIQNKQDKLLLLTKYTKFLLENHQLIKATKILHSLTGLEKTHVVKVTLFRVHQKIQEYLSNFNYFLEMRRKYEQIYDYDMQTGFMRMELMDIMEMKVHFWEEMTNSQINLKKIEEESRKCIDKIEAVQEFFSLKILPIERETYNFTCTTFYIVYLLLTTNYVEYANQLAKDIGKHIENNAIISKAQTCGMELELFQETDKKSKNFTLRITNISKNLLLALKKDRKDLIFHSVSKIIPGEFSSAHNRSFDLWIKSTSFAHENSKVLNQYLQIPFQINENLIYFTGFQTRLCMSHYTGDFRFQTIAYRNQNQGKNYIVDLNGKMLLQEENISKFFFMNESIQEILKEMKDSYEAQKKTDSREVDLQINDNIYHLTFSFFLEKSLTSFGGRPVIRVKIQDQNTKYHNFLPPEFVLKPQSQMLNPYANTTNNENDSQSSVQTNNTTTEKIIKVTSHKNFTWHLIPLRIFLYSIPSVILGLFFLYLYYFQVNNNAKPLKSYAMMFDTLIYFTSTVNIEEDLILYNQGDPQYVKLLEKIAQNQSYPSVAIEKYHDLYEHFEQKITNDMLGEVDFVNQWRRSQYRKIVETKIIKIASGEEITLKFDLQQFFMKMTVQLRYFEKYKFEDTLIGQYFIQQISPKLDQIKNQGGELIDEKYFRQLKYTIVISLGFIILFFIASLLFLKLIAKNKYTEKQIFDLFADLNSYVILKEIRVLEKVKKLTFKNKSSQNLSNRIKKASEHTEVNKEVIFSNKIIDHQKRTERNLTSNNEGRTRAGELVAQDSYLDPKKISAREYAFFGFMVSFAAFILIVMFIKINIIENARGIKSQISFHLEEVLMDNFQIFTAKKFYDYYQKDDRLLFNGTDIRLWLLESVETQYHAEVNRENGVQQAKIEECIQNKLICKYNFSYPILRGIIKRAVFDSFNNKNKILQAEQRGYILSQNLNQKDFRIELFLAQEAYERILILSAKMMESYLQQIEQFQTEMHANFKFLAKVFSIMVALFILYGAISIGILKNSYRRSLMLLTFMNKDMVYRNKRVQSFIERLSKSMR